MTSIAAESKFVELVRGWLVSLPHDLKIAFDAMDDENLPRPVREVAVGVIAYVVAAAVATPPALASVTDPTVSLFTSPTLLKAVEPAPYARVCP